MLRRLKSEEGRRVAIGRMLIHLVVQPVVDDAFGTHAVQLVPEMLDGLHYLFWQLFPGYH